MGSARNVVMGLVAVSALVGALFFLVPQASATQVFLGSYSALAHPSSTASDPYSFDVTSTVVITAGELVPLRWVGVYISPLSGGLGTSNGIIGSRICEGDTDHSAFGTIVTDTLDVSITKIQGGSQTFGTYFGYGYTPTLDPNGYGYTYGTARTLTNLNGYNGGTGYGYGGSSSDMTVVVTVHVSSNSSQSNTCGNSLAAAFASSNTARFLVQTFVGGDKTHMFKGVPATVVWFNPLATHDTTTTNTASTTTFAGSGSSSSGGQTTFTFLLYDNDGTGGSGQNIAAGSTIPGALGGNDLASAISFSFVVQGSGLPSGTQFQITGQDSGTNGFTTQSITNPPFGISSTSLASMTTLPAALYLDITLSTPNGFVNSGDTFTNTVDLVGFTVTVPAAYWTAVGGTSQSANFRIMETSASGSLITIVPSTTNVNGDGSVTFTFTISSFSSFAFIVNNVSSSGGSAGSTTSTTPTTTPVTPVTTPTTTSSPTSTSTGSTATGAAVTSSTPVSPNAGGISPWVIGGVLVGAIVVVGAVLLLRRK